MIKNIKKEEDKISKYLLIICLSLFMMMLSHGMRIDAIFSDYKGIFQNFSTIFLSIVLEASPFIIMGAFISALLQVFVSSEFIIKIIPRNRFLGIIIAGLIGFIFPICECGIVPITRRLMKKGLPISIAIAFMLAVPLVNPIVLISTYYAFYNKPSIVFIRAIFGFLTAVIIGFLVGYIEEGNSVIKDSDNYLEGQCSCGCSVLLDYKMNKSKISSILDHTSSELYNMGRYLIVGAIMSAGFQSFIARNSLIYVGKRTFLSIIILMLLAYGISICSSADAFIAKTFLNQFTLGAVVSFLILGPMIDIKNTLMLSGAFKKKFVVELIFLIFLLCFVIGVIFNFINTLGVI